MFYLESLKKSFESVPDAESEIATFADFQGIKTKSLFMPLRYALLGSPGGVGIAPLMAALGIESTKERIKHALQNLEEE